MATGCCEEKWEHSEDEEEEALSLCDLPVNLVQEEYDNNDEAIIKEEEDEKCQEEFDFGPWRGSFGTKSPEMCVADDIFYQGQILPLRVSVSSETPLIANKSKDEIFNANITCLSRSESLDHGGFTSFSSRSSSSRSSTQYSTTSSNNTTPVTTRRVINNKPRNLIQTQLFQAYPSPKPQIRLSSLQMGSNRTRKSSVWDFFRLGPVRTPEIELQDLKARSSVSRNSSFSSSNSNSSTKMSRTNQGKKIQRKQRLLSGCSCSVSAVKPVPMNITAAKSSKDRIEREVSGYERMVMMTKKVKQKVGEKEGLEGGGKQAMSRHRTYEWIKELSHARYGVDDGGGGQDS